MRLRRLTVAPTMVSSRLRDVANGRAGRKRPSRPRASSACDRVCRDSDRRNLCAIDMPTVIIRPINRCLEGVRVDRLASRFASLAGRSPCYLRLPPADPDRVDLFPADGRMAGFTRKERQHAGRIPAERLHALLRRAARAALHCRVRELQQSPGCDRARGVEPDCAVPQRDRLPRTHARIAGRQLAPLCRGRDTPRRMAGAIPRRIQHSGNVAGR